MTTGTTKGDTWARTTGEGGGISVVTAQRTSRQGNLRTIERLAAYTTDVRRPPAISRAASLLDRLKDVGFEQLLAEQRVAWSQRW